MYFSRFARISAGGGGGKFGESCRVEGELVAYFPWVSPFCKAFAPLNFLEKILRIFGILNMMSNWWGNWLSRGDRRLGPLKSIDA